jgi:hypothetical protein
MTSAPKLLPLLAAAVGCSLGQIQSTAEYNVLDDHRAPHSGPARGPVAVRELAIRYLYPDWSLGGVPVTTDHFDEVANELRDDFMFWARIFLEQAAPGGYRFVALDEKVSQGLVLSSELFHIRMREKKNVYYAYFGFRLDNAATGETLRELRIEVPNHPLDGKPADGFDHSMAAAAINASAVLPKLIGDGVALQSTARQAARPDGRLDALRHEQGLLDLQASRDPRGQQRASRVGQLVEIARRGLPPPCHACGMDAPSCLAALGFDPPALPLPARQQLQAKIQAEYGSVPEICTRCEYGGAVCSLALVELSEKATGTAPTDPSATERAPSEGP